MDHLDHPVILGSCVNLPNEQVDTSMAAITVRLAGPHTPFELVLAGQLDVGRFVSIPAPALMSEAALTNGILFGPKSEQGHRYCHTGVAGKHTEINDGYAIRTCLL